MSSDKRSANVVGGKTARPCDSCLCKRARWYCAADDAFLCQACDSSVHSANPLARRHERLSLKTSGSGSGSLRPEPYPSWIHGFRRKARTPRHSKPSTAKAVAEPPQIPLLVPELSSGDDPLPLDEAQLLYQVPIFDPIIPAVGSNHDEIKPSVLPDYMMEFATCDADLAADVESLLGKGLEDESLSMEALGLMEVGEGEMEWRVKMEEAEEAVLDACHVDADLDLSCDTLDLNFAMETCEDTEEEKKKKKKMMFLRLDYEAVMMEWARQGSLRWTTGDHPNFDPDDRWPDWTGTCGWENQEQVYEVGGGRQMMVDDRGREARVSRYREKRRNRLFSKKIRYEVRKLNAEKRPRMKGRFVKRASLVGGLVAAAAAFPF